MPTQKRFTIPLAFDTVALLLKPEGGVTPVNDASLNNQNVVKIMTASSYDDGGIFPAESVTISGEAIIALRDWLIGHYPPKGVE